MCFGNHSKMEGSTWKLAVFALLVIGSIAETVARSCEDISARCESFKNNNDLNCNYYWEKSFCKKTCNLCTDNGDAEKTGPFLDQLQTNAEEKRQESEACDDEAPGCLKAKQYNLLDCRSLRAKLLCKKSCNICKGNEGTVCKDESQVCLKAKFTNRLDCRSSLAKRVCKKSCNTCGDGWTVCEDESPLCLKAKNDNRLNCRCFTVKRVCKKTCNICVNRGTE